MKKFTVDSEECTLDQILKENVYENGETTFVQEELDWFNNCNIGDDCYMSMSTHIIRIS